MNVPTRLLVMQRLCSLLEDEPLEINGVMVDMKGAVARGRNIVGEEVKPLPFISIMESPRPDVATYAGEDASYRKDHLVLLIQGRIIDDKLNPGDTAYWFEAAVEERLSRIIAVKPASGKPLYPEHHMLGNLISALEIAPPVVRPPEDKISSSAYFFLPVRVGIAVRLQNPYTPVP